MNFKIIFYLFLFNLLILAYNLVGDGNNWIFVILGVNITFYYLLLNDNKLYKAN